ncbi:hypothetical protein E1B28_001396 [Marasmius oreades]|uniref:Uncharacterized protein n=1 Tax=Marasmius oreades TaxID=181124 RepID=A0A9P7V3C5_9AGAR|nr:uncharacterized protein E1B28_001396 [Marasmius oreades]KAG7099563.1 hypothetical protein E1B28_001396 [Marasmius oreades]
MAVLLRALGARWLEMAYRLRGDSRRGPYPQSPKSKDIFECLLQLPVHQFRSVFRVSRDMFDILVKLLTPNPLFQTKGRKPQRHKKYQLGTFLIRYGQLASPIQDTALKVGVGAGTVVLYCRRVTRAIRELRSKFGGWSSEEQRITMERIEEKTGFAGCVGSGDGSLIPSDQMPALVGTSCRVERVSMGMRSKLLLIMTFGLLLGSLGGQQVFLTFGYSKIRTFGFIGMSI